MTLAEVLALVCAGGGIVTLVGLALASSPMTGVGLVIWLVAGLGHLAAS